MRTGEESVDFSEDPPRALLRFSIELDFRGAGLEAGAGEESADFIEDPPRALLSSSGFTKGSDLRSKGSAS